MVHVHPPGNGEQPRARRRAASETGKAAKREAECTEDRPGDAQAQRQAIGVLARGRLPTPAGAAGVSVRARRAGALAGLGQLEHRCRMLWFIVPGRHSIQRTTSPSA